MLGFSPEKAGDLKRPPHFSDVRDKLLLLLSGFFGRGFFRGWLCFGSFFGCGFLGHGILYFSYRFFSGRLRCRTENSENVITLRLDTRKTRGRFLRKCEISPLFFVSERWPLKKKEYVRSCDARFSTTKTSSVSLSHFIDFTSENDAFHAGGNERVAERIGYKRIQADLMRH